MDVGDKATGAGVPLSIVLKPTRAGQDELAHPAAGLSLSQRKLLSRVDGRRTLDSLIGAEPGLTGERVARDGLRLLSLGLASTDEPFQAPMTIMRPLTVTQTTVAPAPPSVRVRAETLQRPSTRMRAPAPRKRGVPAWAWIGGAAAVAAIGFGVLVLRTPARAPVTVAETRVAPPPAATEAPVAKAAAGAASSVVAPVTPPPAIAPRAAAEAPPPPPAVEPHPIAAPQKPAVAIERAPAPKVGRETRASAPVEAAPTKSATVAAVEPSAQRRTSAQLQTAQQPQPQSTQPQSTPTQSTPSRVESLPPAPVPTTAGRTAPADAAAPAATPAPVIAAAPATRPAAPPPSGPRALLPQEREFGAVVGDSEQLARQAAGLSPIQRTPPIYPRAAVKEGVTEGAVRVRLTIAADGSVERVETSVTDPRYRVFEHAARAAAMTWTFVPGAAGRTHESVVQFRAP